MTCNALVLLKIILLGSERDGFAHSKHVPLPRLQTRAAEGSVAVYERPWEHFEPVRLEYTGFDGNWWTVSSTFTFGVDLVLLRIIYLYCLILLFIFVALFGCFTRISSTLIIILPFLVFHFHF